MKSRTDEHKIPTVDPDPAVEKGGASKNGKASSTTSAVEAPPRGRTLSLEERVVQAALRDGAIGGLEVSVATWVENELRARARTEIGDPGPADSVSKKSEDDLESRQNSLEEELRKLETPPDPLVVPPHGAHVIPMVSVLAACGVVGLAVDRFSPLAPLSVRDWIGIALLSVIAVLSTRQAASLTKRGRRALQEITNARARRRARRELRNTREELRKHRAERHRRAEIDDRTTRWVGEEKDRLLSIYKIYREYGSSMKPDAPALGGRLGKRARPAGDAYSRAAELGAAA